MKKIPSLIWVQGRPYFLYKVINNKPNILEFKKRIKGVRLYWTPLYNARTGEKTYAIYLDRKITWY